MKQINSPYYNPYSGKVAVSAAFHTLFAKAARVLPTWMQRVTQHIAIAKLDSRLRADVDVSQEQRLAEIDKPYCENLVMVGTVQEEIENRSDDSCNTQEAGNTRLATGNRDSLSESFNAEIDAWARHALASNGFGDYLG